MEAFADKAVFSIAFAVVGILLYFSLDIFLFLTKRDFENVNIEAVEFTRHDRDSTSDEVRFKGVVGYKIPLKEILRNRFLVWRVIYAGLAVKENPVLDLGSHTYAILSTIRGHITRGTTMGEFKRLAGFAFVETRYQVSILNDRSEDKKSHILRVILMREEDLRNFEEYLSKPPHNTGNFALVKKIKEAFDNGTGSFLKVDVTAS